VGVSGLLYQVRKCLPQREKGGFDHIFGLIIKLIEFVEIRSIQASREGFIQFVEEIKVPLNKLQELICWIFLGLALLQSQLQIGRFIFSIVSDHFLGQLRFALKMIKECSFGNFSFFKYCIQRSTYKAILQNQGKGVVYNLKSRLISISRHTPKV